MFGDTIQGSSLQEAVFFFFFELGKTNATGLLMGDADSRSHKLLGSWGGWGGEETMKQC